MAQSRDVDNLESTLSPHEIFKKVEDKKYLFDIRKVFEYAASKDIELVSMQQHVENKVEVSTELVKAMGSSKILHPEKWVCTYLSNYSTIPLIEEYLEGIASGQLSTDALPPVDNESTPKSLFPDNINNPHLGNPVPRPVTTLDFANFKGDYLDEEGARIRKCKFHKNKFPEYTNLKASTSYLYDLIVRQFVVVHSAAISASACECIAFTTLGLVKLYK